MVAMPPMRGSKKLSERKQQRKEERTGVVGASCHISARYPQSQMLKVKMNRLGKFEDTAGGKWPFVLQVRAPSFDPGTSAF